MCARRFLLIVFILTLLAVAAAVAIFQWGGSVLLRQATPRGHFEPAKAGSGPDYAKLDSWIARPDIPNNPSEWLPSGSIASGKAFEPAAVFYIHPTTYLATDRWNAAIQPGGQAESRINLFVRSQASAFNDVGQVWAPRYRQAAYGAFLLKSEDARQALDFAYADVKAAFDEFLKQVPKDRPIILAGHSQGALHLSRLLMEQGSALRDRIVAAYVVGWPLSLTADLPSMGLPPCISSDQARCILSWMSFGEPANPDFILDHWDDTKGPNGVQRERKDMLCVNPLSGTKDGAAPANAVAGSLAPTADFTDATLANGLTARCDKGLLLVSRNVPALRAFALPGNNYHAYDYALFWGAVRMDVARRLQAWRR